MARIFRLHDFPAIALLVHLVMQSHALAGCGALGSESYRGIGRIAVKLHRSDIDIHRGRIQAAVREMVQKTLPDRIFALIAAIASSQNRDKQQDSANSHNSIITTARNRTSCSPFS